MTDKKKRGLRATLKELFVRLSPLRETKGKEKFYFNGENNLYPYEVERVINSSPSATKARRMMRKFIAGRGLKDGYEDVEVEKDTGKKISELIKDIAEEISYHNGAFIHISYGADLKPKELKILNYVKCRIGKEDSDGWEGKIFVKDWHSEDKSAKDQDKPPVWYYPANINEDVIKSQIMNDNDLEDYEDLDLTKHLSKYRGQVLYLNLMPRYVYSLSPIDSVYNDADSEYRFGLYTNGQLRTGFMGKTIVVTQGLDEEKVDKVSEDLADFMGSEGSQDLYHIDVEQATDIDKVIYVNQLKAQFDDKLFDLTDKRLKKNILGSFNNIPPALVDSSDGSLFGTSGDTYKKMQEFYNDQTEEEREAITTALQKLGFNCEIKPLIDVQLKGSETTELSTDSGEKLQASEETLKSQAGLRGSVGGVQGLLSIQTSVSQGYTTYEAAITLIVEIYGLTREIAVKLLGEPIETEPKTEVV